MDKQRRSSLLDRPELPGPSEDIFAEGVVRDDGNLRSTSGQVTWHTRVIRSLQRLLFNSRVEFGILTASLLTAVVLWTSIDNQRRPSTIDEPEPPPLPEDTFDELLLEDDYDPQPLPPPLPQPPTGRNLAVRSLRRWQGLSVHYKVLAGILAATLLAAVILLSLWYTGLPRSVTAYQLGARQHVPVDIGGGGVVFPRQQFDLSYPATGRALAVMVKVGDQVNVNQPLLKLDPTQMNAALNQASSDVAAAQNYLNSVYATGSPVTIAQAQQSLQIAQSRYNALLAQSSSPNVHNGALLSPMKGVVTDVNINPGEVFSPGFVLLTIMDQSVVIVHARLPLANLGQVQRGQTALVTPASLPDLQVPGTVLSVVPKADAQTDTFEVQVEIAKSQQQVLPGMSAFVRIQVPLYAYAVPRLAVLNPDHESVVFVVHDGHAYVQHIQVIGRSANAVYILGNLAPASDLVLAPLDSLRDGQAVNVKHVEYQP